MNEVNILIYIYNNEEVNRRQFMQNIISHRKKSLMLKPGIHSYIWSKG